MRWRRTLIFSSLHGMRDGERRKEDARRNLARLHASRDSPPCGLVTPQISPQSQRRMSDRGRETDNQNPALFLVA